MMSENTYVVDDEVGEDIVIINDNTTIPDDAIITTFSPAEFVSVVPKSGCQFVGKNASSALLFQLLDCLRDKAPHILDDLKVDVIKSIRE